MIRLYRETYPDEISELWHHTFHGKTFYLVILTAAPKTVLIAETEDLARELFPD